MKLITFAGLITERKLFMVSLHYFSKFVSTDECDGNGKTPKKERKSLMTPKSKYKKFNGFQI